MISPALTQVRIVEQFRQQVYGDTACREKGAATFVARSSVSLDRRDHQH